MLAELLPHGHTSTSDQIKGIDITDIRGRYVALVSPAGLEAIAGCSIAATGLITGAALYHWWMPTSEETRLEGLEPKGDALDAMVAKFPAPKVWYEED